MNKQFEMLGRAQICFIPFNNPIADDSIVGHYIITLQPTGTLEQIDYRVYVSKTDYWMLMRQPELLKHYIYSRVVGADPFKHPISLFDSRRCNLLLRKLFDSYTPEALSKNLKWFLEKCEVL